MVSAMPRSFSVETGESRAILSSHHVAHVQGMHDCRLVVPDDVEMKSARSRPFISTSRATIALLETLPRDEHRKGMGHQGLVDRFSRDPGSRGVVATSPFLSL